MAHKAMWYRAGVFGNLTTFAFLNPSLDVRGHSWPITTAPDQFGGPFDALVTMLMVQLFQGFLFENCWQEKLKNLLSPFQVEDPAM